MGNFTFYLKVQLHVTSTYFAVIGYRLVSELGRIVRELPFVRCEHCHWNARVQNKLSPEGWGRRGDMPPPIAVRLAADLRPSEDCMARSPHMAKCRQAV